jgi:hypothetical protein
MGYCAKPEEASEHERTQVQLWPYEGPDCHIIMTQLLPVALRGILPPKVRAPIIKLCSFFNVISRNVIDVSTLDQLQRDIAKTLVRLEMYFSLTYFDILLHLLIHLVL